MTDSRKRGCRRGVTITRGINRVTPGRIDKACNMAKLSEDFTEDGSIFHQPVVLLGPEFAVFLDSDSKFNQPVVLLGPQFALFLIYLLSFLVQFLFAGSKNLRKIASLTLVS